MMFLFGFAVGFVAFPPVVIGVFYLLDRARDPIQ